MAGGEFLKSKTAKHPSSGGRFAARPDPIGPELGDGLKDALEGGQTKRATRAAAAENKRIGDVKSAESNAAGGDTV
jgi:hypothetical protein